MTETNDTAEINRLRLRSARLERENDELRAVIAGYDALTGILSTCANCKNVRNGDEWVRIEAFLKSRFDVDFSHSLCPTCAPDFGLTEG